MANWLPELASILRAYAPPPSMAEGLAPLKETAMMLLDGRELFYLRVNTLDAATVRAVLTLVRYHANTPARTQASWKQLPLFKKGKRYGKR